MAQARIGILNASCHRGFSMVEVLAALVIFSVTVVALIQNIGSAAALQTDLLMMQRAAMLAENVIEETKLDGTLKDGEREGQFQDQDSDYAWRVGIDETPTSDLMEVTVTVSWNSGRGAKDYRLTTLLWRQTKAL